MESPIALAPWLKNIEAFRRSGSVVEGSRTGLTLDKHLDDNNSDRRPRRLTEPNRKPLSKGIESPTVLDVGNTEALRGRHKNVTGRSCRSFGNPAACNKQDPILFPLYFPPTTRHVDSVTKNIGVLAKPGGTEGDFSKSSRTVGVLMKPNRIVGGSSEKPTSRKHGGTLFEELKKVDLEEFGRGGYQSPKKVTQAVEDLSQSVGHGAGPPGSE